MSDSPSPADQEARQRFITETGVNFCVCAGAGAGKTTAITRRIASLAADRVSDPRLLSKLVVVTYTVLAAEELRTRTRQVLLQRLSEPGAALARTGASAHGRQDLLRDLRGAFFGTIHGFCLKLIREFGGRLGLPGHPELIDDRQLDEDWERFTQTPALDDVSVPEELLRHITFPDLLRVARGLATENLASILSFPGPGPHPGPPDLSRLDPAAINHTKSRSNAERDCAALEKWQEECQVSGAFAPIPKLTSGSKDFVAAYDAAMAELRHWISGSTLLSAAAMAERFREHRFARGRLSYADQIRCARSLLDDPEILREIRSRGWRVILDEAQDTDSTMFEILTEITRPLEAPRGEWPERGPGPEAGRFSFVGDEQQSIYGDRADPADYRRYVHAFFERRGGELLTFDVTMRCSVLVVDAVNEIFAKGIPHQQHVDFRALKARPLAAAGTVWRLSIPSPAPEAKTDEILLHEAEHVGRWLRALGPAGLGVDKWSDLAVIAPRRKWLTATAQLWTGQFDLPTRELSSNHTQRESPATSWPIALLHVLVEPSDRFELLGVLREIFAISDRELAVQHLSHGLNFWPVVSPPAPGTSTRLSRALLCLRDLRQAMTRDDFSVGRLFDELVQATQLESRLRALGYSCDPLQSLRAGALAAECAGASMRSWVRTLLSSLDQPPAEPTESVNAIAFLTCQKAKGLEWPAVLLLGFGRPLREGGKNEAFPRVATTSNGEVVVQLQPDQDAAAKTEAHLMRDEEWQRFVYVTMTRAKACLVVPDSSSFYVKKLDAPGRTDFAGLIRWKESSPPANFVLPPPSPEASPPAVTTVPSIEARAGTITLEATANAAAVSAMIPVAQTPSRLAHGSRSDQSLPDATNDPPADPLDAEFVPLLGIGGKDYGTWWHDTLQRFPWRSDSATRAAHAITAGDHIPATAEWRDRGRDELNRFSSSSLCRDLLAAGVNFQSEIPFAHAIAGEPPIWIEGILDLLVLRADDTAWIIDWKTDRQQAGESDQALLARLQETYAPQLAAYADAIQAAGRMVTRRTIYSTALGSAIDC